MLCLTAQETSAIHCPTALGVNHSNSLPLTTDFKGGMQCSFKELCNFLNKSSDEQHLILKQSAYIAYSQPIFVNIFKQETD